MVKTTSSFQKVFLGAAFAITAFMAVPQAHAQAPTEFQQGLADREAFESWFAGLSGEYGAGANFWAGQRSLRNPIPCASLGGQATEGCNAAKARLDVSDARRMLAPAYRQGWNSYVVARPPPSPAPQAEAPPPAPTPQAAAPSGDETYTRECKASPIRPGFVGYCDWMNKSRDEASERQQRSGLVEGQWYLVANDSVICEIPDSLHIGQQNCINIPKGEPVRMLWADDYKPVVAFKIFPNGGAIARDAIGPAARCTVTETVDRRPYSSTTPVRSLSCTADPAPQATTISPPAAGSVPLSAKAPHGISDWRVRQRDEFDQPTCNVANNGALLSTDLPPLILRIDSTKSQNMTLWFLGEHPQPTQGSVDVEFKVDNAADSWALPALAELNDMLAHFRMDAAAADMFARFGQAKTLTVLFAGKSYEVNLTGFAEAYADFQSCVSALPR